MSNASFRTEVEFQKLSTKLIESSVALAELEMQLKTGAGATENAKKKFRELSKEADRLRKSIDRSREGLGKMETKLRESTGLASATGRAVIALGSDFSQASRGVDDFNDSLRQNQQELEGVGAAADRTASSIGSIDRASRNLGSVVQGDVDDPSNIQRAISRLNAQLRQVGLAGSGAANRIQSRFIRAELERLEADLREANQQFRGSIVEAIINSNQELTTEELDRKIQERLALRQRQGLLPTSGLTEPGFTPVQPVRF